MENTAVRTETITPDVVITPQALHRHWQAHRGLSRRMIEAFPEEQLFNFSVGGMRPFVELAMEMIDLASGGIQGLVTNEWPSVGQMDHHLKKLPKTKADLLALWDEVTAKIDAYWPQIAPGRVQETVKAFGQYENVAINSLLYIIDNEIHHRGQGYVYLRALGIEPPFFWDRN